MHTILKSLAVFLALAAAALAQQGTVFRREGTTAVPLDQPYIKSLNGLTKPSQTFVATTTGCVAFSVTSVNSTHTFCSPAAPWGSITGSLAAQTDLAAALAAKEPTIAAGTTGQYWRGDKSWQTLDKTAVGLGSVLNVAQEPAIAAGTTGQYWRGDKSWQTLDKTAVGLGSVLNVAQEPAITAGTTGEYWRGDKSWQTFDTAARAALSGTAPVGYDSASGAVSCATCVVTSGSYADPAWLTSLAGSKVSGNIAGNAANVTGTVAIGNGGSGQTTATAAFDALSGMTTLGDVIYGGASGTRTRLAGQITATKKYLSQTGTGAVSAAPGWAQIAAADISGLAASATTDTTSATNIASGTLDSARLPSDLPAASTGAHLWTSRTKLTAPADGDLLITNNAGSSMGSIFLGGTTASFPRLKRAGTNIDFRVGDDSAYSSITALSLTLSSGGYFWIQSRYGAGDLVACSGTTEGAFQVVTDSNTATWGATVTNGGANHILAYCDGTNWTVAAK